MSKFKKKKGGGLRLWSRDDLIIDECSRNLFTTSQIAKLHFTSNKKCAERLRKLFLSGFVSRFQAPLSDVRGKPEFVYCRKGGGVKKGFSWVRHGLCVSDFFVWLMDEIKKQSGVGVDFLFGGEVCEGRGLCGGGLFPDAAFVLSKGGKRLLYFLEVDLGTESLTSSRSYGFCEKLDLFSDVFDSGEYWEVFGKGFKGFRVAVVFVSKKRMNNFLEVAKGRGADFVLASILSDVVGSDLFGKVWSTVDGKVVSLSGK